MHTCNVKYFSRDKIFFESALLCAQDTRSVGSPAGSKSGLFKLRKSGSRESLGSAVIAGVLPDSRTRSFSSTYWFSKDS